MSLTGIDYGDSEQKLINDLVERVSRGDGELIPLPGVKSRLGEPLSVSARFGEDAVESGVNYLIVDVLAKREGKYIPVGIYDWEVKGEKAVGNKQRHGHLPAKNPAQEEADRYWSTGEAFHVREDDLLKYASDNGGFDKMNELRTRGIVQGEDDWTDPVYQKRGIGGLMTVVSALVLEKQGVTQMNLGTLSESARISWEKFDRRDRIELAPGDVTKHQNADKILYKFLMG
jgi:hypothetical protein